MTATLDAPTALLAELTSLGIELQVHGDRLRFRPRSAMTAELVARVKAHKAALLQLLANTKTPAGGPEKRGFGNGDGGDMPTDPSHPAHEQATVARLPADVHTSVKPTARVVAGGTLAGAQRVDAAAREPAAWPDPDRVAKLSPIVADLARQRDGWTPESWRDRLMYLANACEATHATRAGQLRRAAVALSPGLIGPFQELVGGMQCRDGLATEQVSCYSIWDGRATRKVAERDRNERPKPVSHFEANRRRGKRLIAVHQRRNAAEYRDCGTAGRVSGT